MSLFRSRLARNLGLVVGLGAGIVGFSRGASAAAPRDAPVAPPLAAAPQEAGSPGVAPVADPGYDVATSDADLDVAAANPIHHTVSARPPSRRLTSRKLGVPTYVVPLYQDTEVHIANPSDLAVQLWYATGRTNLDQAIAHPITLFPYQQTHLSFAGVTEPALFGVALPAGDVTVRVWSQQHKDGLGTGTMPLSPADLLQTAEWGRVPLDERIAHGLLLTSGSQGGDVAINILNGAGNVQAPADLTTTLAPWSLLYLPDIASAVGVSVPVRGQLLVVPLAPGMQAWSVDGNQDFHTASLLTQRLADTEFLLPVVQRQTVSVPYGRVTDLLTINPDEEPFQKWLNAAFYARDTTGNETFGASKQLYALSMDRWEDVVTNFFNILPGSIGTA